MAFIERGLLAKRERAKSKVGKMHLRMKGLCLWQTCPMSRHATHIDGAACKAGGGSRGRSPHLAAVGKEGEEVFVVARR